MARFYDVHPANPQPRAVKQVVQLVRDGALIAYPTDSGYAFGWMIGNADGLERIAAIRHLDSHHHYTLVCHDIAQVSQFVSLGNRAFRSIKSVTPGPYTFILPASREVPRRLAHPKKRTVGVRIPDDAVAQALVSELGEPLMSSTLLLPGDDEPMSRGWEVKERLDTLVDAVVDSGDCLAQPTTVVDLTGGSAEVVRLGAGDPAPFE
ncbi:MAG: hypothetical protein RLZ55_439 [Actinomycetota bacterium]|jgi:tRNA threonylcarbamoyl adenosine modification protein (Sua5/YciO/YrdC/YwlC family)